MLFIVTTLLGCPKPAPVEAVPTAAVPLAERRELVETLHGVSVSDPYRWLEDSESADVDAWTVARQAEFMAFTDAQPLKKELYERLQALWRYDDATVRDECLISKRQVWRTKKADQDKWVVHLAEGPDDAGKVVVDPNTWETVETLGAFSPSPDCRYAVVGKARAGDENAVLRVLDLDTLEYLPDTLQGWKQGGISWKHDNSGFYYSSKPTAEEKADGGHFYFHRVWWHTLKSQAPADTLVLHDDAVKEYFHGVSVSEDGRWLLRYQSRFNTNRLWLQDLAPPAPAKPVKAPKGAPVVAAASVPGEPVPVAVEMDGEYQGFVIGEKLYVLTDWNAPRRRLMVAPVSDPAREQWKEVVPERQATLKDVVAAGGRLYAIYQHNVATQIVMFDLEGKDLGEVPLPTIGTAFVDGEFAKAEVRVVFFSFANPATVYRLDADKKALTVLKESAIPIDRALLDRIVVDQAWFQSKDGTKVPMFVVHDKDATGPLPTLLTGYGGFDVSMTPSFSTTYALWLERGGVVAIPNLRGGGEFGRAWHEAGMRDRKQNVFDDFIGAAEWLVAEGWTTPKQLAISGGSNGGLLVSAAVTQRPELFGAVHCAVPLTDMVRFHRFGLANIWSEEYGSAEVPEQLPYLHAYSPYHQVKPNTDYPAILVVGSKNDARTDPAHARKFMAAVQWADVDHGAKQPILLSIQGDSGHGGGVTIDTRADQAARAQAFLMAAVGLTQTPVASATSANTP